jgi:hypothetical protein
MLNVVMARALAIDVPQMESSGSDDTIFFILGVMLSAQLNYSTDSSAIAARRLLTTLPSAYEDPLMN